MNEHGLLASTLNQFGAVCLLRPNLENVSQLLVRECIQVWPNLVVLTVSLILFQPLSNWIVGTRWYARQQQCQEHQ